MSNIPFHLAFPVKDLAATRAFFEGILGCPVGRTHSHWIDFDFFGHQITAHLSPTDCRTANTSKVDLHQVPVRHFGAILPWEQWEQLADLLREKEVSFHIEPHVRFGGQVGEQGTFFIADPSGNCLEFKSFKDDAGVFASDQSAGQSGNSGSSAGEGQ